MTPLRLMNRQTFLGWFFLLLGIALIALAAAPIVAALRAHAPPPPVTMLFLGFLLIGIVVAIFGAWLLPSSGAPVAVTQMVAVVGPWIPRVPGLSRVGDPAPTADPPSPPGEP
jgi:hypothetical protein